MFKLILKLFKLFKKEDKKEDKKEVPLNQRTTVKLTPIIPTPIPEEQYIASTAYEMASSDGFRETPTRYWRKAEQKISESKKLKAIKKDAK
jgi:hypothetical protein